MEISACENATLLISGSDGEVETTLKDWYTIGPSYRWYLSPIKIICENGVEKPIQLMPVEYRNTPLARFLIAMGLYSYPWTYNAPKPDEIVKFSSVSETQMVFVGRAEVRRQSDFNEIIFNETKLLVPSNLSLAFCEILGETYVIADLGQQISHKNNTHIVSIPKKEGEAIVVIRINNGACSNLSELFEMLKPNNDVSILEQHSLGIGNAKSHLFSICKLPQKDVSVGIFLLELENFGSHITSWLEIFSILPSNSFEDFEQIKNQLLQNL